MISGRASVGTFFREFLQRIPSGKLRVALIGKERERLAAALAPLKTVVVVDESDDTFQIGLYTDSPSRIVPTVGFVQLEAMSPESIVFFVNGMARGQSLRELENVNGAIPLFVKGNGQDGFVTLRCGRIPERSERVVLSIRSPQACWITIVAIASDGVITGTPDSIQLQPNEPHEIGATPFGAGGVDVVKIFATRYPIKLPISEGGKKQDNQVRENLPDMIMAALARQINANSEMLRKLPQQAKVGDISMDKHLAVDGWSVSTFNVILRPT